IRNQKNLFRLISMSSNKDSKGKRVFKRLKEEFARAGSQPGAEEKVRKSFWSYFKKNKANISFGNQIEKIYDLLISGKLSGADKAIIIGALLYFINPFDVIPDLTPIL